MTRSLTTLTGLLLAGAAQAHPGHGMPGNFHWHATDAFGLALVVAAAAGAWWWVRRK